MPGSQPARPDIDDPDVALGKKELSSNNTIWNKSNMQKKLHFCIRKNLSYFSFILLVFLAVFLLQEKVFGTFLTVKKVYTGNTIKLSDGRKIQYLGLSVPDKQKKPFYSMCKEANRKLIENKVLTVKTDEVVNHGENRRLLAYVYTDGLFVNAELIRQGYALAHMMPANNFYKAYFLSLQREARQNQRGLWAFEDAGTEPYYVGSKSKKVFHRPQCFHVEGIDFDDRILFRTQAEAQKKGFNQDWRCSPLFKESISH